MSAMDKIRQITASGARPASGSFSSMYSCCTVRCLTGALGGVTPFLASGTVPLASWTVAWGSACVGPGLAPGATPGLSGFGAMGDLDSGTVVAPASIFVPGGLDPTALGGPGGRIAPPGIFASGTVGEIDGGGTPGGRGGPAGAPGARGTDGAGVRRTCVVGARVAGAGSGALGSWMGAVDLLVPPPTWPIGEVGTRAVAAPAGVTEVVIGCGTDVVPRPETGEVCSLG